MLEAKLDKLPTAAIALGQFRSPRLFSQFVAPLGLVRRYQQQHNKKFIPPTPFTSAAESSCICWHNEIASNLCCTLQQTVKIPSPSGGAAHDARSIQLHGCIITPPLLYVFYTQPVLHLSSSLLQTRHSCIGHTVPVIFSGSGKFCWRCVSI